MKRTLKRWCYLPLSLVWLVLYMGTAVTFLWLLVWWAVTGRKVWFVKLLDNSAEFLFGTYWDRIDEWADR